MKAFVKQFVFIVGMISVFCLAAFAQQNDNACSEIKVTGPQSALKSGESAVFYVTVGNRLTGEYGYDWNVTAGTISQGQGTSKIEVNTSGLPSGDLTASVKVTGLPAQCADTASGEISVSMPGCGLSSAEFGDLPDNEVRPRLDNFFIELQNDPESRGLIQIFFSKRDSRVKRARLTRVRFDHILFRKMDPARITFAFAESESGNNNTRLHIIPKGVALPVEGGSVVIPAAYLKDQIPYLFK